MTNTRGTKTNILLALTIFILFLLLFEDGLVIPLWLQSFGRMHAMIVHFPIVLLLMWSVLEFFRFSATGAKRKFYDGLTGYILFSAAIVSGLTVIMGLFLAQGQDFQDQALALHKWTGAGVFFTAALFYSCRRLSWFDQFAARAGAVVTTIILLAAGHFGGALTHGEDFVLKPVLPVSAPGGYDFPAADQSTLENLNSNYRVIRPVSKHEPALAVNIFNRNEYTSQSLEDLKAVRTQVVSLDVSNMPVSDGDLKYIGQLENLQRLNLNFTDVTGAGLTAFHSLTKLEHVSLAGTEVHYKEIGNILSGLKSLKSIALWETGLTKEELVALGRDFSGVDVLGMPDGNTARIKLNPPRLKNTSRVFKDTLFLQLFHAVRDVDIRFTTDGTEPDSISSMLFENNTLLTRTSSIRARAFKDGWQSSEATTLQVYRCAHPPDTAIVLSRMNRVHTANGANTFFDHQLGSFNANSPAWANNWGGFRGNDMELLLQYKDPVLAGSISLNLLIETENSIFPPATLEIWGGSSSADLRLMSRQETQLPDVYRKPYIQLLDCEFEPRQVSFLKIVAKPVMKLPGWHKNKDRAALLLIDEILVN
ncbi:MAG: chitobiase/beta-hexosaminidase C-terminal domain-containing protein [Bacteroidota bacterium]|nr:chitobiase/beta-hexosaminidase C-terminal domain-containing protein [Bacteroidota bacterium]